MIWETWQQPNAGIEELYAAPTAPELSKHLGNAVAWIKAHLDTTHGKAVLIYAWNKNDEGDWLVPTLNEGHSHLRAVQSALRNAH